MKKSKKILIIVSVCMICAGLLICTGVMAFLGFDFSKLDNSVYTENIYEFNQSISNLEIDVRTTDISILPASDNKVKVVCYEDEDNIHTVSAQEGTLYIDAARKEWHEYINLINFKSPEITIYLPEATYNRIDIECTTGDIEINSITASGIDIELTTGDADIRNANLTSLKIESTTGDVYLNNAICENYMEIDVTTGDITFSRSDAKSIKAETTTGDISGTLLSDKTFFTDTSTGDIDVPRTTGNPCELETTTGDIMIRITE